jgi:hypothetical protein
LWHGAGVSFVLWGLIHGLLLCLNHVWFGFRERTGLPPVPKVAAIALTFLAVVFAWVPFRAGSYELLGGHFGMSMDVTRTIYASMCGFHGFDGWPADGVAVAKESRVFRALGMALLIVWLLPNSQRWLGRYSPHLGAPAAPLAPIHRRLAWRPTLAWLAVTLALVYAVGSELDKLSEFIYYQF